MADVQCSDSFFLDNQLSGVNRSLILQLRLICSFLLLKSGFQHLERGDDQNSLGNTGSGTGQQTAQWADLEYKLVLRIRTRRAINLSIFVSQEASIELIKIPAYLFNRQYIPTINNTKVH